MFDLPEKAVKIADNVAYTLDDGPAFAGDDEWGVDRLLVWHWCDHHLWAGREAYDEHPEKYLGWVPANVAAHTLVSRDPLHLEPSLLWADCCGTHGFLRGGQWAGV